ncbi:uncharacterized protein LOC117186376 [Drosophila miranda]|uniref:uncharacterized protein LOC117186376 n=1 Tax=Drosophila miranda TaxID=7229 RepID=UPI00143F53D2|nr:uncharacterized protein LOC117186376 [Drosophila miranda]
MAPRKGKDAEVLTSRTALMNSFVRNKVYIEKNSDSMTAAELEARLSLIETNFNQFCNIQAKIEHDSEDASEYESRYEAEEVYCELKAKLLSCLGNRGRRQSNVGDLLNSTQVSRSSRLPKLKLPEFAGKFTEWTSWYNTFATLIESDSELDELSKFIHLRASLGAGPLSAIEGLELTGPNYRKALRLLKDRYENKAIILQSHVQELFNLRRLKRPDSEGLRVLVDNVNAQLVALKSLSDDKEILDAVIFHLIRTKLDEDTMDRWEVEWDCQKLPSWSLLSQFLINRGVNMANREVRRGNGARPSGKGEMKNATLAATIGSNGCYVCPGTHGLKGCQRFNELSPVQRYHEAKKHSLCLICFSKRHTTRNCNGPRCRICSKPHHELLHREILLPMSRGSKGRSCKSQSHCIAPYCLDHPPTFLRPL